jgi:hypothetical protein
MLGQEHQSTCYQLNYFLPNQDVPEEARSVIKEAMLMELSCDETDIVAHYCSDEIQNTVRVVHASKYDATLMRVCSRHFVQYLELRVVVDMGHHQLIQHNLLNPRHI